MVGEAARQGPTRYQSGPSKVERAVPEGEVQIVRALAPMVVAEPFAPRLRAEVAVVEEVAPDRW
jgi:hypothetical protein